MSQTAATRLRPATLEELSQQIRAAAAGRVRVRIAGSDSLPLTVFGENDSVRTISMLRLNKVIHHPVGDMSVTVQAGITLEALQKQLAWHDQWLPVDPPVIGGSWDSSAAPARSPGQRTIGGLIASNSLGPLRFGSGDWRLLILGMKWMDAQGKLLKGGGATVKNVAGYSTPRMMIGSCGSLGAIVEVTLRTFARPKDERCLILFCENAAHVEEVMAAVMLSPTNPGYVQAIGGRTFAANPLQLPPPTIGGEGGAGAIVLVIGFLGRTDDCAAQIEKIRALPAIRGAESISQTAAQSGRLRLWMTSEPTLSSEGRGLGGGAGFRIHAKSSDVTAIIAALENASAKNACWLVAEAGTGVIRGAVQGTDARKAVERTADQRGASVLWTQVQPQSAGGSQLARRIKAQLDSANLFGDLPE